MSSAHGQMMEHESDCVEGPTITSLPDELLMMIFAKLDFQTRKRCERVCWSWVCVIRGTKILQFPNGIDGCVTVDLAQETQDQEREEREDALPLPFMNNHEVQDIPTVRREVSFLEVKDSRVPSFGSHPLLSSLAVFSRMPILNECRPGVIILDGITIGIHELDDQNIKDTFRRSRRIILRDVYVEVHPLKKDLPYTFYDDGLSNPLTRTIAHITADPLDDDGVVGQVLRHLESEEANQPLSEIERHRLVQIARAVYPGYTHALVNFAGKYQPWSIWYVTDTPLRFRAVLQAGANMNLE